MTLSKLKGLITFWASKEEMPVFDRLHREHDPVDSQ